jgi:hypothetical protein
MADNFIVEHPVDGVWLAGPYAGMRAVVRDVRAGALFATSSEGELLSGAPADFLADTGESGDALLSRLLPNPSAESFLRGVVRACLVGVVSIARIGRQDARAFDAPGRYLVNDGEGNVAGALFLSHGRCVAAINDHDSSRVLDVATQVTSLPAALRESMTSLCELPFLTSLGRSRITAVFWERDGKLYADEPWHRVYLHGGDIFRDELMSETAWKAASQEEHSLPEGMVDLIVMVSHRALWGQSIELTEGEFAMLVPPGAKYRDEAVDELFYGGVFKVG